MKFDYIGMGMRILWAEALSEIHTAIVIECSGQLLGGVVHMREMTLHMDHAQPIYGLNGSAHYAPDPQTARVDLKMFFEWYEVVDSAEAFRRGKRWQQEKLAAHKYLPAPVTP